jgi:general secretion pathway protein A
MVLRHFNLREQPFGVTPDPRFLFATETHREALSALLYGIESGLGFIALTANPGMGKTTLLFEALAQLRERFRTVFLFQAIQSPVDLVRALLIDLGEKDPQGSMVDLEMRLNEILVSQSETGKRLVVVIDESQNLDGSVLEAVRMLSNFETASRKLMQIVLCGQLQLADRLDDPALLQLRQRISIFAYLKPLSLFETVDYIEHRLKVAGYSGSKPLFTSEAMTLIARHSRGIPRNINNLCFNALSLGCALKKDVIGADAIREVIVDLTVRRKTFPERITVIEADPVPPRRSMGERLRRAWPSLRVPAIAVMLFFLVTLAGERLILANSAALSAAKAVRSDRASGAPAPAGAADPIPSSQSKPEFVDPPSRPLAVRPTAEVHRKTDSADTSAENTRPEDGVRLPEDSVRLVEARDGQSLSTICAEQFSECSPDLLNRIIELNPRIADPDHVRKGQRVILPVAATGPAVNDPEPAGG